MKEETRTDEILKLLKKEAKEMLHLWKMSVPLLPHWSRNSQGKKGIYPVITPVMDNCDGVKMGHLISH